MRNLLRRPAAIVPVQCTTNAELGIEIVRLSLGTVVRKIGALDIKIITRSFSAFDERKQDVQVAERSKLTLEQPGQLD